MWMCMHMLADTLAFHHSTVSGLYSCHEAVSAQRLPSATECRECKNRVTLCCSQGRRLRSNRPYGYRAQCPPMGITTFTPPIDAAAQAG